MALLDVLRQFAAFGFQVLTDVADLAFKNAQRLLLFSQLGLGARFGATGVG